MVMADDHPSQSELEPREPTVEDLRDLLVDLMGSAGGIDYAEAAKDIAVHDVDSVPIPFASPRLLWRMKAVTHREKDAADLVFLRHWFAQRGEQPPAV